MKGKNSRTKSDETVRKRPATDPESREQQLISLAISAAEKQLREGTASPSVITHYLKLGSSRELMEKEKLKKEIEQMSAKIESIKRGELIEEKYDNAIKAMKQYKGESEEDDSYLF